MFASADVLLTESETSANSSFCPDGRAVGIENDGCSSVALLRSGRDGFAGCFDREGSWNAVRRQRFRGRPSSHRQLPLPLSPPLQLQSASDVHDAPAC
jgi:hypothetical protein